MAGLLCCCAVESCGRAALLPSSSCEKKPRRRPPALKPVAAAANSPTTACRFFLSYQFCGARGPRPRYPRVWKTRKRIGTISKSQKLVQCVIKWMFNKGQGKTMGSYYALLNALFEDGRVEEAEELFGKIFSRYLIFADMKELGVRPDGSIVRMLSEVFQELDMLDKYKNPPPKWEYRYIKGKRIRIRVYPDNSTGEATRGDPDTDELEVAESINIDNGLEEATSTGLDRNVLDDAACDDLEFV